MGEIAEAFRAGGVWMYLILTIGLLSNPLGVLVGFGTLFAQERHRKGLIILGSLTLLSGVAALFPAWQDPEHSVWEDPEPPDVVGPRFVFSGLED